MISRWLERYSTDQPLGIEIALDQLTLSHFIKLMDKPATLIRHLIDSLCGESLLNSTIFRFSESSAGLTTEYTTVKQNTIMYFQKYFQTKMTASCNFKLTLLNNKKKITFKPQSDIPRDDLLEAATILLFFMGSKE